MTIFLDRIDSAPIAYSDFDNQFLQWLWVLVDSLNENIGDIQDAFNVLTAPNYAFLSETVTLTLGSPSFTVADGTLYNIGDNVVGAGIPIGANILTIASNTITLDDNATANGPSALTFIPLEGNSAANGVLLYDATNHVYVGMENDVLVKFTTAPYP